MELKDDSKDSFIEAIGPSIYSNSTSSVLSYVTIFENLWQQSELYDQIKLANERLAEKSEQIVLKDKELQNLIFKLLQEDKSKEEFMSMVSHELKTPISVIKFYTDMLLKISKMGQTTDAQKKALATIYRNVDKLELLVNDILDVYKLDIGKMNITKSHVNVAELVNETISDLNSFIVEKNIKVLTEIKDNESVNCDRKRIEQVLSNLIKNSIDFVPREKGIIIIKVEHYDCTKDKRQVNESIIYPVENMTLFSVEDNGPGIPADKSENIFKKFYQIDTSLTRKHGGTGLGLTICKGIVEAHGGTIWIDKSSNEGTVVKFILPVDGIEK
jgi:signal transduction histidine kinase